MQVNNQTSDPVDWEQNGGIPPTEDGVDCPITGHLEPGHKSDPFEPCGVPPYTVTFTSTSTVKLPRMASVKGVKTADAEVILVSFPLVFEMSFP